LAGQPKREISTLRLAQIIQARMEEILEYVQSEIVSSGYHKSLIGGIVMTGGGAQLRNMKQLVEYQTGMHCRIGSPNYHVSISRDETKLTPVLSTGVGLLMTYENSENQFNTLQPSVADMGKELEEEPIVDEPIVGEVSGAVEEEITEPVVETKPEAKKKKAVFSLDWLKSLLEEQFKENLD
jgi:cell division ATPase FtsA